MDWLQPNPFQENMLAHPYKEEHYAIERVYSDLSAAHERGQRFKQRGAYRVTVEPEGGRYIVTAWFRSLEEAEGGLE